MTDLCFLPSYDERFYAFSTITAHIHPVVPVRQLLHDSLLLLLQLVDVANPDSFAIILYDNSNHLIFCGVVMYINPKSAQVADSCHKPPDYMSHQLCSSVITAAAYL